MTWKLSGAIGDASRFCCPRCHGPLGRGIALWRAGVALDGPLQNARKCFCKSGTYVCRPRRKSIFCSRQIPSKNRPKTTKSGKKKSCFDKKRQKTTRFALPILTFSGQNGLGAIKNAVWTSRKGKKPYFRELSTTTYVRRPERKCFCKSGTYVKSSK